MTWRTRRDPGSPLDVPLPKPLRRVAATVIALPLGGRGYRIAVTLWQDVSRRDIQNRVTR